MMWMRLWGGGFSLTLAKGRLRSYCGLSVAPVSSGIVGHYGSDSML